MPLLTRTLAETLSATRYSDLPAAAVGDTKRAILDWLGSALAGALEPPARTVQQWVARLGISDEATVFADGRASAAGAALANGVASHVLELDDVHKGSTLHGAAPVIPAALAVAEREHADGRSFLLAVTLGYEAALRIGEAVNPTHYRFWHPTGTVGTFGAAAAAGSLIGLNAAQMTDALGSAGTQAAGLWEFNADGAMSKHLHPGKAAFNGVLSADLARAGFTGASRILEGERGFFRAMSASHDASRITDGLGSKWKITENCYKLHACCGHTHSAIDVSLALRTQGNRSGPEAFRQVTDIHIETYGPGFEIVREPDPRSPYQAKFSIAYCVVAALLDGEVGLAQFAPDRFGGHGVRDAAAAALLQRTRTTVADDLTAQYPAAWPARVSITFNDGTVLAGAAEYPRGNPENPVSTAELEEKFLGVVGARLGADVATRVLETVRSVGSSPDMAGTFRHLLHAPHAVLGAPA
ncbi:MAG TPA: MmgE/PrpD family protein [Gemmatimonadaceae bacterium]|nr:MmgE/PrpD family protein [Gemmatimonadaceae bacterium]